MTDSTAATTIKVISLNTGVCFRMVLVGVLHGCLAAALDALAEVLASKTGLFQQQLGFLPARQGQLERSQDSITVPNLNIDAKVIFFPAKPYSPPS